MKRQGEGEEDFPVKLWRKLSYDGRACEFGRLGNTAVITRRMLCFYIAPPTISTIRGDPLFSRYQMDPSVFLILAVKPGSPAFKTPLVCLTNYNGNKAGRLDALIRIRLF